MEGLRSCPVCNMNSENSSLFIKENIDKSKLSEFSYLSLKDPEYMCFLLENTDYSEVEVKTFKNTYSLQYWIRLLPLPTLIKHGSIKLMAFLGLSNRKVALIVGNIISSVFKRE